MEGLCEEVTLRRDMKDEKEPIRNSIGGTGNSTCKAPDMGPSLVGVTSRVRWGDREDAKSVDLKATAVVRWEGWVQVTL